MNFRPKVLAAGGAIFILAAILIVGILRKNFPLQIAGSPRTHRPEKLPAPKLDQEHQNRTSNDINLSPSENEVNFKNVDAAWITASSQDEELKIKFGIIATLAGIDFSKTLDFIKLKTEPGSLRDDLITGCFMTSKISFREAFKQAEDLEPTGEAKLARRGIAERIARGQDSLSELVAILPGLDTEEISAVGQGLGDRYSLFTNQQQVTPFAEIQTDMTAVSELLSPQQNETFLLALSARYNNGVENQFAMWNFLQPQLQNMPSSVVNEIEINIGRRMVEAEPERTMDMVLAANVSAEAAAGIISSWTMMDPSRAQEWYEKNVVLLPIGYADAIGVRFVSAAILRGDVVEARRWMNSIENPAERGAASAAINDYLRTIRH